MSRKPIVAIVGATGVVGQEILNLISERNFPHQEIRLFASEDSQGELYKHEDHQLEVKVIDDNSFKGINIALFATSATLSEQYVPLALEAGALVIDNSAHFRLDPKVPLIVPEINGASLTREQRLIANPNCTTIQLVMALNEIHQLSPLKRVVISSYQAVSGAGKYALDELWSQSLAIFNQRPIEVEVLPAQIAFNCIPQVDVFQDNGYTREENKVIAETRKILNQPNLAVTATCVRVPVFHSHAVSANVQTASELNLSKLIENLSHNSAFKVYAEKGEYPLQLDAAGTDEVHIGRIRKDDSAENAINLWIVADNVRKGAALNALQIAELYQKRFAE